MMVKWLPGFLKTEREKERGASNGKAKKKKARSAKYYLRTNFCRN